MGREGLLLLRTLHLGATLRLGMLLMRTPLRLLRGRRRVADHTILLRLEAGTVMSGSGN